MKPLLERLALKPNRWSCPHSLSDVAAEDWRSIRDAELLLTEEFESSRQDLNAGIAQRLSTDEIDLKLTRHSKACRRLAAFLENQHKCLHGESSHSRESAFAALKTFSIEAVAQAESAPSTTAKHSASAGS